MYTEEQTQALKDYKVALSEYNQGTITYETYIELTLPLWEKLNSLFEKTQN